MSTIIHLRLHPNSTSVHLSPPFSPIFDIADTLIERGGWLKVNIGSDLGTTLYCNTGMGDAIGDGMDSSGGRAAEEAEELLGSYLQHTPFPQTPSRCHRHCLPLQSATFIDNPFFCFFRSHRHRPSHSQFCVRPPFYFSLHAIPCLEGTHTVLVTQFAGTLSRIFFI
jgi:hypothetical protein